ncbi:MAG: hypothetical protein JXR20_02980 [Balneola sp.]
MNVGIVTSFVIGGLMLISILTLNVQTTKYASESTLEIVNNIRMESLSDVLTNDFQKIGQGLPSGASPFITLESNRIQFRSDAFYGDDRDFSTITWEFRANEEFTASSNPNDYTLIRSDVITGSLTNTTQEFGVSHFEITYLNQNGSVVTGLPGNKNLIRKIRVEIICESFESTSKDASGDPIYNKVMWSKIFYPENVQYLNQ